MKLKIGRVCEAFRAMCALKGSFSRMGAFVLLTEDSQKRENRTFSVQSPQTAVYGCIAEASLTCLRLDVCEKDFEQMEQT